MTIPIPEAPGHPLWQNAIDLFRDPFQFFRDSYLSLGPVFRVRAPGRDYVVIAGPEANQQLLGRPGCPHLDHQPMYARIARELGSEHYVIATDGARHAHLRRQVAAQLTARAIGPRLPGMLEASIAVCQRWTAGKTYGVLPEMHQLIGNIVGMALAHTPLGDRVKDAITFARYSVGPALGSYPWWFRYNPRYLLARKRMKRFLQEIIEDHRTHLPADGRRADFIDGLLAMTDEEGRPLPDVAIFANAQMVYTNSILYGGPSSAFLLYVLLRNPELVDQLTAAVDSVLEQGPATPMLLCELPSVLKVVRESMRLHPIALATPRVVREPFDFEGYHIPKGERVLIAGTVCHHLDQLHPDSQQFDPDRKLSRGHYVPFGGGPHQCPAGGLMEIVSAVAVLGILRTVKLELASKDYLLRKVVNPFPEPARDFRFRVVGIRS